MADGIPLDIQIDIICRLPVKSLIRFRSVSKQWKSLIHSSDFNSNYTVRKVQQKRLLITNCDYFIDDNRNQTVDDDHDHDVDDGDDDDDRRRRKSYCWIVDDDDDDDDNTLPKHKVCLTYPPSVNLLKVEDHLKFVGSSHGLLCFSGYYAGEYDSYNRYVIWNPSIRKSVVIDALYCNKFDVAFGVCPNSFDPKIIKINRIYVPYDDGGRRYVWRVEVFSLSSGVWRSPLIELPSKWFDVYLEENKTPLAVNGFIYWCASEYIIDTYHYMFISFDLATEEFMKIEFPDKLDGDCFEIFKLRESVGVAQIKSKYEEQQQQQYSISQCIKYYCNVWLMDHVSKSFMKLFTFNLEESWLVRVLGYKANNQLIIETVDYLSGLEGCVAYEPYSEQFKKLEISVDASPFFTSYTESLLLLNQPHTINDDDEGE